MKPSNDRNQNGHEDMRELRNLVLRHVVKGEVQRRVFEYLVDVYLAGDQERVSACDISEHGGPRDDETVAVLICRLRESLAEFFAYHPEGRLLENRIAFNPNDRGNYALSIERNTAPSGFLAGFWRHHQPPSLTTVIYPEFLCSCNGGGTLDGNEDSASEGVLRLAPGCGEDSLVSASSVRCFLKLLSCFQTWNVPLPAMPYHPSGGQVEGDLIVLGTPQGMAVLLSRLEAAAPMKSSVRGIISNGVKDKPTLLYKDTVESPEQKEGDGLIKWVLLTRHHYRYQRTLTILAAKNQRAIEPVVHLLTKEDAILPLARELKFRDSFPDHFQVLFAVHMGVGHPYARSITIEKAVVLPSALPVTGTQELITHS